MENKPLPDEIKWRGSTYRLDHVDDDGKVHWFNPVSRHRQSCSRDAWLASDPYDGHYS